MSEPTSRERLYALVVGTWIVALGIVWCIALLADPHP